MPLADLESRRSPQASTSQLPITLPHDLGPPLPTTPPKRGRSLADEAMSQPRPRARMESEPGRLYPAQMSLYDTLLSPSLDSLPGGTFSPVLEAGADGAARPVKRQRGNTAPGVSMASKALASPTRGSATVARRALASRPAPLKTNMGPPPLPTSKHRRTGSMPSTRLLSTSDPSFARDVPDLLDAAAALTSFSRAPNSPSMTARASVSPTVGHRPGSAPPLVLKGPSTPPSDHPEDLLLFLASSPSPVTNRRFNVPSLDQINSGSGDDARSNGDREKSAGSEASTPTSPLAVKRLQSAENELKPTTPLSPTVPRSLAAPSVGLLLPSAPISTTVASPSISA